jgi:hypothetical protein
LAQVTPLPPQPPPLPLAADYFFHLSGRNMWLLRYLICAFFLTVVSSQKFKDTKAGKTFMVFFLKVS